MVSIYIVMTVVWRMVMSVYIVMSVVWRMVMSVYIVMSVVWRMVGDECLYIDRFVGMWRVMTVMGSVEYKR